MNLNLTHLPAAQTIPSWGEQQNAKRKVQNAKRKTQNAASSPKDNHERI